MTPLSIHHAAQRDIPVRRMMDARRLEENAACQRYEQLWKQPQQYRPNPFLLRRTWQLIEKYGPWQGKNGIDLGCGWGSLTHLLHAAGAQMTALDIAQTALKRVRSEGIKLVQACLPRTELPDSAFDGVFCTDVIAELPSHQQRGLLSEIARLLKPTGLLICSTKLDNRSEDPLGAFLALLSTECDPLEGSFSHHQLSVHLEKVARLVWRGRPTHAIVIAKKKSHRRGSQGIELNP